MDDVLKIIVFISFGFLLIALLLALRRLLKGPDIYDRIAAMDLMATIICGFILIYTILVNDEIYFDIVVIISLISFVSTIAISAYLKRISTKK